MIQVRVLGIALDAARQHIVLLKPLLEEPGEGSVLPIWIGAQEATSILLAVSGEHPPRPLTHDLMKTLLDTVGAQVERVEVTRIDEGTFFAELTLTTPAGPLVLDTRPSDAVALAVRTEAPLFVAQELLDEAGIPAEVAEPRTGAAEPRTEEEKLDEFKRFLEDVDPEDFQG
ncbi:bifunctional nuclease family protein [Agromyces sp. NPDC058484]|uniref:bifunctional nuclease family protein n=1 Tax=Agromyces sp. NPDC058484 TaxID=3346524 RepID=UPI0036642FF3